MATARRTRTRVAAAENGLQAIVKARRTPSRGVDALENSVQKTICEYLTAAGIPYVVTNVAPKGWTRRRTRKVEAGWPDITACVRGRFVGFEVKREKGGKVLDTQVDKHAELRKHGALVAVVKSIDEVICILAGLV